MATLAISVRAASGKTGQASRPGLHVPRLLIRTGAILACLLFWDVATRLKLDFGILSFRNVPSPGATAAGMVAFFEGPNAARHLFASIARVGQGFMIAAIIGITLGLLTGRSRRIADIVMPPLEILRPIPAVAWIPLAILMLPTSEGSMIFITFLGGFFPILLNTAHGVETVDPRLVASARSLGAGRVAVFREIIIPCALPAMLTGLVLGIGSAWFCLVTAEMISGQYGIGYYTWASYTVQDYPGVIVGMILIGLLGMASTLLLRSAGQALMPWRTANGGKL